MENDTNVRVSNRGTARQD